MQITNSHLKTAGISLVLIITAIVLLYGTIYTVDERDVGIIKRNGKAVAQVEPGLHAKVPFIDEVVPMEVRTKKYSTVLTASTVGKNPETGAVELQMPSRVTISANWSIPRDDALTVYKDFGSLDQYEKRILDPKFSNAVKQAFSHYDIETIISDRETVRVEIEDTLKALLGKSTAIVSAVNLENIAFHGKIAAAVTKKQVAKLALQEQRDILAKQDLEAQESTNIDKAKAAGIKAISVEKAAAISREGLAEAEAITAKAKALGSNTNIVKLTEAQNWDGKLPTTVMGGSAMPIMDMRAK